MGQGNGEGSLAEQLFLPLLWYMSTIPNMSPAVKASAAIVEGAYQPELPRNAKWSNAFPQRHGGARGRLRQTCWALAAAGLFGAACAQFWQVNRPADCFARALVAIRAQNAADVEYELMWLAGKSDYEAQSSLLAGWLFLERRDVERALDEFRFTTDIPGQKSLSLALIGRAFYQAQRFPEAEKALLASLRENPDEVEAHRWLGAAYYDVGRIPQAEAHLLRVAELAPADPRPHRLIGQIRREAGEFDGAIESYQESLRRDAHQPDRDAILLELTRCLYHLRRYDDAIATLADGPSNPDSWALQAECHQALNRAADAQRLLDQALAVDPDHELSLFLASTLAKEAGNKERVVELLSRAAAAHPESYQLHYSLSQALRAAGRNDDSQRVQAAAEALRKVYERLDSLKSLAVTDTASAQLRYEIGALSAQLGNFEAAEGWFKAALALDRNHAASRQALERLAEMKPN